MKHARSKNLLMTGLLLIALILSGWLAKNSLTHTNYSSSNTSSTPDSFMNKVQFTEFNKQGQWQNQFFSPKAVHYSAKDIMVMTDPHLTSRGQQSLTWIIDANSAISEQGGKIINLKGNVKLDRIPDSDSNHKLTLQTTALTAYTEKKFVKTDQPVTIIQPGTVIKATGLTADLNSGDINLLSATKGIYDSNKP